MGVTDPSPDRRTDPKEKNDAHPLTALVAAAMALPGIGSAQAQETNTDAVNTDYNRVWYIESDSRMRIQEDRLSISAPVFDRFRVGGLIHFTDISGASPFAVRPKSNGDPALVFESVGAASMENADGLGRNIDLQDNRTAGELNARYFGDKYDAGAHVGVTTEIDYDARYGGFDINYYLNRKQTTVFLSGSYSDDFLHGAWFTEGFREDKMRMEALVGISHIINQDSTIQVNLAYSRQSGYLTNPHKAVWVVGSAEIAVPERRPETRNHMSFFTQYSHYLELFEAAAAHVSYRYTRDDWQTNSHTVDGQIRADLGKGWQIAPRLRYYTQDNAYFYDLFFQDATLPRYRSSDYRLATFGTLTTELEASKKFQFKSEYVDALRVRGYIQHYSRSNGLALTGERGDPIDNFSVKVIGISLEGVF